VKGESLTVVFRAMQFAAERHVHQRRKGGRDIPYNNHPSAVATLLATVGGVTDTEVLAAALLHDTVEDTPTSPQELEELFGTRIASLVAEVTDDPTITGEERKVVQELEAPFKSPAAKLIRLADKTCNVSDITRNPPHTWSVERQVAYFDWAERVVKGLLGSHAALEAAFAEAISAARGSARPCTQP
jgi:guanosine-3',5'-bis(diphosphate) 3'-pyrophosphohydrolase